MLLCWNCLNLLFFPLLQLTSTDSDPSLGFTVVSCFVSPNSNPSVSSDYVLIENVCPKDDSVVLQQQKDFPTGGSGGRRKAFSFNFKSELKKSLLFLHCEMSLCSTRLHRSQSLPPVRSSSLLLSGSFPLLTLNKPSAVISERVRHACLAFVGEAAAIWNLADPEPLRLRAPVLGGKKQQNYKKHCKASMSFRIFCSHCVIYLGLKKRV